MTRYDASIVTTPPILRPPMVGRTTELARLGSLLAQAREGRGGLGLLVGEAGIGKTRLAREFADAAGAAGATVVWGRCYEGDGAPPYAPWIEILGQIVRGMPPERLPDGLGQ